MELNRMIDHTILKADATRESVQTILMKPKSIIFTQYVSIQPGLPLHLNN